MTTGPDVIRGCETHEEFISTKELAAWICGRIGEMVQEAKPAYDLRRTLRAFGRPAGVLSVVAAIGTLSEYIFALELIEVGETCCEQEAKRLQAAMVAYASQRTQEAGGSDKYVRSVETIFGQLSEVAAQGANVYVRAAELFLNRLGLDGESKKNLRNGTWLECWEALLLGNTKIARIYLSNLVAAEGGWNKKRLWLYRHVQPNESGHGILGFNVRGSVTPFGENPIRLAAVRLSDERWLLRPSHASWKLKLSRLDEIRVSSGEMAALELIDAALSEALIHKLSAHKHNIRYVEMIFTAMDLLNVWLVAGPDVFPNTSEQGNLSSLETSREATLNEAKAGDRLFTAVPSRPLSRAIARLDRGSWSHMLLVGGGRKVIDTLPEGVIERNIEEYLTGSHRFALCRPYASGVTSQSDRAIAESDVSARHLKYLLGMSYGWRGALRAAFDSWLHVQVPLAGHATPNALIYQGNLKPLVVW